MYTVGEGESPISKEQLIKKHPAVFTEGVGRLEGEYCIRLDPQAQPVQDAPRRVPVALRDRLQHLVKQGVLAPVTKLYGGSAKERWQDLCVP